MKAIITTTVNVPGNLGPWRDSLDDTDVVFVAGDRNSPHDEITEFLSSLPGENVYIHPTQQEKWEVSEQIGWRCVQRRNIALLEAMARQPEYIITVDDDNFPTTSLQTLTYDRVFANDVDNFLVSSSSGWCNPGLALSPAVTHRGFPRNQRSTPSSLTVATLFPPIKVGVAASLWIGDPDIDAVERMCCDPRVTSLTMPHFTLAKGTWAPFNSQATAFIQRFAPAMFMWPHVGRYDDIWASYLVRAIMDAHGYLVHYGEPLVHQSRNEHDVFKDYDAEIFGMRHTPELVAALREISRMLSSEWSMIDTLGYAFSELRMMSFIPQATRLAWDAWLNDLRTLERQGVKFE